jgi:hypothetical protein
MDEKLSDQIDATSIDGYVEFEFDLPSALLGRLIDVFSEIEPAKLDIRTTQTIPDEQGVYQLFLDEVLVYVGKTDGDAGLRSRLSRHATKMLHRSNLDPSRVSYKAVRVFVFTAMDLEGDLIRHYGGVKKLAWNGSGFGSNDPGKERDTTRVKAQNFDAQYPIDIDRPIEFEIENGETIALALSRLKGSLPFTLRFEMIAPRSRTPHSDLTDSKLPALRGVTTARKIFQHLVQPLPRGWKITALPGYVIMYKNDPRKIPSGSVVAASP